MMAPGMARVKISHTRLRTSRKTVRVLWGNWVGLVLFLGLGALVVLDAYREKVEN